MEELKINPSFCEIQITILVAVILLFLFIIASIVFPLVFFTFWFSYLIVRNYWIKLKNEIKDLKRQLRSANSQKLMDNNNNILE